MWPIVIFSIVSAVLINNVNNSLHISHYRAIFYLSISWVCVLEGNFLSQPFISVNGRNKNFFFCLLFDLLCGLEKANFRNLISLFYLCQPVVGNEKRRIKLSVGKVFIKTKAVMSRVAKISSKKHKAGTVQERRHKAIESEPEASSSEVSHSWNQPRN